MIDQEVMIPTPFDHTQRVPLGEYHPPQVVLTTDEEHRLTNRATAYRPPALRAIANNVIPKPPSQGKREIIKHFIKNPGNIGRPDDAQVYEILRAEANHHKHALLRAKEQIPIHLPKTWNHVDKMAKAAEISLFEYKVYWMFRLPMHLCEDHWVANFLLRKAVTIHEARE